MGTRRRPHLERGDRLGGGHRSLAVPSFTYQEVGRLEEAVTRYERTLADRERVLGAQHPDPLISRNNLAGAHQAAGRPGDRVTTVLQSNSTRHPNVVYTDLSHGASS